MSKISVVINTLNEEDNLLGAIKSVKRFADEVVVVDMHSEDKTVEIAKKAGTKVYYHKKEGYVEPARNYAIKKAEGDWILILDADERIPKSLGVQLVKISKNKKIDYVAIPRRNLVFGKWLKHSRWWPDYNIRFFKKGKVTWDNKIHSIPETVGNGRDLEAKKENAITHHNYDSISQYVRRMDRYTGVQSKELIKSGYKFSWEDIIRKPINEFLSRYFRGYGYKDGVHGLILAILQGFSEALVYIKVWELEGSKRTTLEVKDVVKEIRSSQKDVNYWLSDLLLNKNGGLVNRIRRKLKI